MDRRSFIGTSLLTAAAGAYAAGAEAAKDPHVEWVSELKDVEKRWGNCVEGSEEDALLSRQYRLISERIYTTVARTPEGLNAQFACIMDDFGSSYFGEGIEYRAMKTVLDGLEALSV